MAFDNVFNKPGLPDLLEIGGDIRFAVLDEQRNYTSTISEDVDPLLNDIYSVLSGASANQFSGVMISIERSDSPSLKKCTIIYGLQTVRTMFLMLHAIKEIMLTKGMEETADRLERMCRSFNPFASTGNNSFKPVVFDDDVYQCIVRRDYDNAICEGSNVYVNFEYILKYLLSLSSDYTPGQIIDAINHLRFMIIS